MPIVWLSHFPVRDPGKTQLSFGYHCHCLVVKSCPTLCNPMDFSLPGSSVHGISQTRILEWGFPGGVVVKNPAANAGDPGLISGLGRSYGEENDTPL